jgi:phosphopantetheinyl transferase
MPLLSKTEENNATILIWELTESIQELEKISSFSNTSHLHSEKRKKEFICSRLLLKEYNSDLQISYTENGSPILSNEEFISISHSANLIVIAVSKKNIGVDIQEISEKPKKLFSKFGNSHHTDLSKEKCTLVWSIKESVFKYHKIGNVDFRNDIYIPSFTEKGKGKLEITFKNKVTLSSFYKRINNYYLSYVCNYK